MRGAEFAADLYWVSRGDGSREYVESAEFFRRTYLTDGLRELLAAATRRIAGDRNASPVWNLQTNFGGGKTHSMLALYHLLSGTPLAEYPDEVHKVLSGVTLPSARRAVLVGNHFKAGAATPKPGGTQVHTLWGELAWQLGFSAGGEAEARRAYEIVRSADETRSNPADSLGHADRRLRAVPDPDRRVGRLRPAALRARGPGGRDVRHAVHVRADADGGRQGGAWGAAGGVHPGVVGRADGRGGRAGRDRASRSAGSTGCRRWPGCSR